MMNKFVLFIIIVLSICFLIIKDKPLIVDEKPHYAQIKGFTEGNFTLNPDLTTIPGYHYTMYFMASFFKVSSFQWIRLFSLFFSVLSIVIFFKLSKKISKNHRLKTLQFFSLPIIFPLFFLIYTDVFSMFFVLLSLYFLLAERYNLSGFSAIACVLVRQNNIAWLVFICVLIYYEKYRVDYNLEIFIDFLKTIWSFILGMVGFVVFIIINKGVSLGDTVNHPSFRLHSGNMFFMLFLFFIFFLPLNIANIMKFNRKSILIVILFFTLYIFTFTNNHPYNIDWGNYILRNKILIYFSSTPFLKILFFLPIAFSIMSLSVTTLRNKSYYLLYPFTVLFLVPSWLIEQRYYIVPFSLFILFKNEKSRLVEYSTIAMYIVTSALLFYGIQKGLFFL